MSTDLHLPTSKDRAIVHASLLPQIRALLHDEHDAIAAMANVSAALMQAFKWHWIGFYRVVGNELVLGPFQGPVACMRIPYGKGVCGAAWAEARPITVPDVDLFPGHIACSALSRSEVVIPLRGRAGSIMAVLDIDSSEVNDFTESDTQALVRICALLEPLFE